MDTTQIAALVAAAVIVFWMVGAYNRLIALRNGIGAAFAQLDEGLKRRGDASVGLIAALRQALTAERGALDALAHASGPLTAAADALRERPASAAASKTLASAEAEFASAGSRVRALAEQQAVLLADAGNGVAAQLAAWQDADVRIRFARQLFNDAVQTYNAAAQQFPTRWLAWLYGLGAAGQL